MTRRLTARFLGAVGLAVTIALAGAGTAWGAPAPVDPAPTAAHPLQGLRRLTVATVPPVPGMQFAIDGQVFSADARGVASTLVTKAQREAVRSDRDAHLTVVNPLFETASGVRARFTGWSGPGQYRAGQPPEEYQRATFDLEYLTSFAFTTKAGAPVAATELGPMELTSSLGDHVRLRPGESRWLQGSRTATGANGLQSRAVSYRVDSVRAGGSNVVNRGQQRFFPSRGTQVPVRLLFFDVQFKARDALLGRVAGSSILLRYPDGHEATFPFRADHSVTVRNLPRGTYHVTVRGAGPEVAQKLTVSKDQIADLDTVTWIDIALGGALVLLIVTVLVVLRRRKRRRAEPVDLAAAEREEKELVGAP